MKPDGSARRARRPASKELIPTGGTPDFSWDSQELGNLICYCPGRFCGVVAVSKAIEISHLKETPGELRRLASSSKVAEVVRRLLAVALLLEGRSREEAALLNGMTRQTLRDWVHRYNAAGVEGLRSRTGPGRPPFLTEARMEELREIVLNGPEPERHTVIRWRCVDLCAEIAGRWSVKVCEQTMGTWLRRLEMTRLQPRPYHPKKDPAAEVAFKKTSAAW